MLNWLNHRDKIDWRLQIEDCRLQKFKSAICNLKSKILKPQALVVVFSVSLCLCGESPAALDPQLKNPYHLQVVLHIAENRFLTPVFREQVERDLGDQLRLAFGPLARVEVV